MPKSEMLINYVPGEECRIAIVEDGRLEEFYHERASSESHVSNIYKGRVTNVEPAIQAAFVDFGLERNGFLHISDLHPKYFNGKDREEFEKVGQKTARHERPPIQKCLKRGQEVLVQVLKEGIGTKGPTLTSYLSIPGRFLVMMPDMQRLGVSRKVEDDEARREMKDILKTLDPPKEFGFIVRTAGIGQTKADLKRDLSYLQRLWKNIERKRKKTKRVGELYAESDLVIRTIRDVFNNDINRIVCDDLDAARRARDFLTVANPRTKSEVVFYDDPVPVFNRFGIETQIEHMGSREVPLPSGGALVIDQAEALVAVDVNSGKSRAARDAETNAYQTNLEAVDEIARQMRLRDLGGLVVLDLIDMRPLKNRKAVETRFRNNLKKDRARTRVGPISQFGLLEMTRQRMRPSLNKTINQECKHCAGRGYSMSSESVVLSVMRRLAMVMHRKDVARIELTISPDVAFHILNRKRGELVDIESKYGKPVMVRVGGSTIDHIHVGAFDVKGHALADDLEHAPGKLIAPTRTTFRDLDDPALPTYERIEEEDDYTSEPEETPESVEEDAQASSENTDTSNESSSRRRDDDSDDEDRPKRRRRRRRGGRGRNKRSSDNDGDRNSNGDRDNDSSEEQNASESNDSRQDADSDSSDSEKSDDNAKQDKQDKPDKQPAAEQGERSDEGESSDDGETKKPRRRRRRRGKKSSDPPTEDAQPQAAESTTEPQEVDGNAVEPKANADDAEEKPSKPKRRRRRRSSSRSTQENNDAEPNGNVAESNGHAEPAPKTKDADSAVSRGYSNRVVDAE